MALGFREEFTPARWLSVSKGRAYDYKEDVEFGWVSGVIDGIRVVHNEKFGHLEFHVRVVDPDVEPDGETVILAGSLTTPQKGFTIWSRMFLGRLLAPEAELGPGEKIRIEFYPIETDYGPTTGIAMYRDGSKDPVPFVKIGRDQHDVTVEYLNRAIGQYEWGRGATSNEIGERLQVLAGLAHAQRSELPRAQAQTQAQTPDYEVVDTGPSEPPPPSDADGGGDHDDLPF